MLTSAALSPIDAVSASKNSCVLPALALNLEPNLSNILLNLLLLNLKFFPSVASLLEAVNKPLKPAVNNAPSVPNFNLFNNSVCGLSDSLSIAVIPPTKSPRVPASSTSAIAMASATPAAPACAPNFKYLPPFFPAKATSANLPAVFAASPAGTARLTNNSDILPAVVCCAYSSKGFISAKNSSTSVAVSVPAPKSINVAPRDTTPSGILKKPEPIPAINVPMLLGLSSICSPKDKPSSTFTSPVSVSWSPKLAI